MLLPIVLFSFVFLANKGTSLNIKRFSFIKVKPPKRTINISACCFSQGPLQNINEFTVSGYRMIFKAKFPWKSKHNIDRNSYEDMLILGVTSKLTGM